MLACRKDLEETVIIDTVYTPPVIKVDGTIAGKVIDEAGNNLEGAVVHLGNEQTTTGPGGFFQFQNVAFDANGTFLKVDQAGFFHASTRIFPRLNSTHYVTLTLMPMSRLDAIEPGVGGTINLPGGARITLPANGMIKADGSTPEEGVWVSARQLDPSADNLSRIMPGNLQGVDAEDNEVALASYGMLAVEIFTNTGERLYLAPEVKARVYFPIPEKLLAGAPEKIPLWHFDLETGLWREEGFVIREGSGYLGEVAHFSFWNCGVPYPLVRVEGKLVNEDGIAYPNTLIRMKMKSTGLAGSGFTDHEGVFSGKVPAGEPLLFVVNDPCNVAVFEQEIGPLNEDTDFGGIVLSNPPVTFTKISGLLTDCDGNPVETGTIEVCWSGNCSFIVSAADGSFEKLFPYCAGADQFTVTGFDPENLLQSQPLMFNTEPAIHAGMITACAGQIQSYVRLNVNGNEHLYPFAEFSRQPGGWNTVYVAPPDSTSFSFELNFPEEPVTGTYYQDGIRFSSLDFWPAELRGFCSAGFCNLTLNITEFGLVGGFVKGNFNGIVTFLDIGLSTQTDLPVSGEFVVIRTE